MLDLEYKQSLQIVSMLTEAGRYKEALKLARETFENFKVIDSELIFLLYKLNLRQGDTREASVHLMYLAFSVSEECQGELNRKQNKILRQLDDFLASLGYLVMLDDINHVSAAKKYMTSETRADFDLFVKSQFDKDLDRKICAVSLARFRSENFRAEAIRLGSGRVYDLLGMINDGHENQMKLRFMREIFSKIPLEEFHRKINALNEIAERYDLYATETGIKQKAAFFIESSERTLMDEPTTEEYALLKKVEGEFDAIAYSRYDDAVKYATRLLKKHAFIEAYRLRAQAYEARNRFKLAFDDYCVEAMLRAFRYQKLRTGDDFKLLDFCKKAAVNVALEYIIAYNHYAWTVDMSRAFAYAVKVSKASISGKALLMREYPSEAASDELKECEKMLEDKEFMGNILQLGIDLIERYLIPRFSRSNYGNLPENFKEELALTISDAEYWEVFKALEKMPEILGQNN
ncbi:hypothetical protein [Ligilactobacillus sp.]|uniref:hypothetical protein n=1 Tax=Ligilactobacillus sp. TaxID=2767921 RepID=UPI002FE14682